MASAHASRKKFEFFKKSKSYIDLFLENKIPVSECETMEHTAGM